MTDETQATREARCTRCGFPRSTHFVMQGNLHPCHDFRSLSYEISAATALLREAGWVCIEPDGDVTLAMAALLREAGWKVEEPVCPLCWGKKEVTCERDGVRWKEQCPTCNGTGKREVDE